MELLLRWSVRVKSKPACSTLGALAAMIGSSAPIEDSKISMRSSRRARMRSSIVLSLTKLRCRIALFLLADSVDSTYPLFDLHGFHGES